MRGKRGWICVREREVNRNSEEGSLGICLDITALRAAQDALDTARKQLGAVANAAPVILFATDAEGRITLSEGKGLESLGRRPGQMPAGDITALFAATSSRVPRRRGGRAIARRPAASRPSSRA
jgi:PAS domain-containing protein